jgi:hypothetical protein
LPVEACATITSRAGGSIWVARLERDHRGDRVACACDRGHVIADLGIARELRRESQRSLEG